ncbi:MAG: hypothetical protein H8E87_07210 [FCB group bacterium]|nr:hypothetical protein [FCB group bacterium]
MEKGQGKLISFVPITGKGSIRYLPLSYAGDSERANFNSVWNSFHTSTLYIGKIIDLGGYAAYHDAHGAVERWDGKIIMINPSGKIGGGVIKLE